MEKKKLKISIFYIIYTLLTLAAIVAIAFGANKLWSYLYDYESSLPKYEAERVFDKYYSPCDFTLLFEMTGAEISEYETAEHFKKYMENKVDGREITYYEVSAGLGDIKKFVVKAGDEKISDFTLKKTGTLTENGFDTWELDRIDLVYSKDESITFSHIKGGEVKLNGKPLDISKCTLVEDNIPTYNHGHMLEGANAAPITYATYKLDGFLLAPKLETFDKDGKKSVLSFDEAKGLYKEEINYDEELREKKLQITTEGAQVYLRYMTRDAYAGTLNLYFDQTSAMYKKIRTSETWWFADHIGYEFRDVELSEYYAYSEDTFSCRYKCTHVIKRTSTDIFEFPIDITFYFREVGDDTLVYDLVSNN